MPTSNHLNTLRESIEREYRESTERVCRAREYMSERVLREYRESIEGKGGRREGGRESLEK